MTVSQTGAAEEGCVNCYRDLSELSAALLSTPAASTQLPYQPHKHVF